MDFTLLAFYAFAAMAVLSAGAVIAVRNPVNAALFLVLTYFSAATSNGSRNRVNSVRAIHSVFDMPAASAGSTGNACMRAEMPTSARISSSITTATARPTGRYRT